MNFTHFSSKKPVLLAELITLTKGGWTESWNFDSHKFKWKVSTHSNPCPLPHLKIS
jgi:hypothetical protein